MNSFDEDLNVNNPNDFLDLLAQHKIYLVKNLKDIISTKVVLRLVIVFK